MNVSFLFPKIGNAFLIPIPQGWEWIFISFPFPKFEDGFNFDTAKIQVMPVKLSSMFHADVSIPPWLSVQLKPKPARALLNLSYDTIHVLQYE